MTTWEIAGGIEPVPFRLIIPEGCFQPDEGFLQVRSYRKCGVKAVLESPEFGEVAMPIHAFTTMVTGGSGPSCMSITAAIDISTEVGDLAALVPGTIGGGRQIVQVGRASAARLSKGVQVFGFDPQPEPPARIGRY